MIVDFRCPEPFLAHNIFLGQAEAMALPVLEIRGTIHVKTIATVLIGIKCVGLQQPAAILACAINIIHAFVVQQEGVCAGE
jgi:hypothetical protein